MAPENDRPFYAFHLWNNRVEMDRSISFCSSFPPFIWCIGIRLFTFFAAADDDRSWGVKILPPADSDNACSAI